MGLDMYLHGEKLLWNDYNNPSNNRMEDGFKVSTIILDLGYWRKHPNLHGAIVNMFADGKDDCQKIYLDAMELRMLIKKVEEGKLPHTEGFFFGASCGDEKPQDLRILRAALAWLEGGKIAPQLEKVAEVANVGTMYKVDPDQFADLKETRSVYYQASW